MSILSSYLLIIFLVMGIYLPTIFAPFNSIDDLKMSDYLFNTDFPGINNLFLPGGSGYYYRPLVMLTFWGDKYFWGLQESFMHLENIILHALNSCLVFSVGSALAKKYSMNKNSWIPFLAALFFAIHPINTEAVNWISGRTDVLAAFFLFSSMILAIKSVDKIDFLFVFVAALAFLLACLAKETSLFFLPGVCFLVYTLQNETDRLSISSLTLKHIYIHFFMVSSAVMYFVLRKMAFSKGDSGVAHAVQNVVVSGQSTDYLYQTKVLFKVVGFYASKLIFPWPLNFGIIKFSDGFVFAGIIVVVGIFYCLWKKRPFDSLYVMSFLIICPALIVAFGKMAWTPVAERYLYIPSAPFVLAFVISASLSGIPERYKQTSTLVVGMICAIFIWSTVQRNIIWQDNESLFADTMKKSPEFLPARNDLAIAKINKGKTDEGYGLIREMKIPDSLKNSELASFNKAHVLISEKKYEQAIKILYPISEKPSRHTMKALELLIVCNEHILRDEQSLAVKKQSSLNLVNLLLKKHNIAHDPFNYYRIGQFLLMAGRRNEAGSYFIKAYNESPEGAYYKNPAKILADSLLKSDK